MLRYRNSISPTGLGSIDMWVCRQKVGSRTQFVFEKYGQSGYCSAKKAFTHIQIMLIGVLLTRLSVRDLSGEEVSISDRSA